MKGVEVCLTCGDCQGTGIMPFCDLDCPYCAGSGSTVERIGQDLHQDLARARTPRELVARLEEAAEACESYADQWRRSKAHVQADAFAGEAAALRVAAVVLRDMLQPPPGPPVPTSRLGKLIRRLWRAA